MLQELLAKFQQQYSVISVSVYQYICHSGFLVAFRKDVFSGEEGESTLQQFSLSVYYSAAIIKSCC